jgi:hypothetical protein
MKPVRMYRYLRWLWHFLIQMKHSGIVLNNYNLLLLGFENPQIQDKWTHFQTDMINQMRFQVLMTVSMKMTSHVEYSTVLFRGS